MMQFKAKYKSEYNKINSSSDVKDNNNTFKVLNKSHIGVRYWVNSDRNRNENDVYKKVVTTSDKA